MDNAYEVSAYARPSGKAVHELWVAKRPPAVTIALNMRVIIITSKNVVSEGRTRAI